MKIGYICGYSTYPPRTASSIHSYQVTSRLLEMGHQLYGFQYEKNSDFVTFPLTRSGALKMAREIDVLYIRGDYNCYNETYTMLKMVRLFRLPVVWELNAPLEELYAPGLTHKNPHSLVTKGNIKRKILSLIVDATVCVSEQMRRYSEDFLRIKKAVMVPNGSDTRLFHPDRTGPTQIDVYSDYIKIFWAGSPQYPWQGYELIIELANAYHGIDKKVLFMMTTGPEHSTCRMRDNILILGKIDYASLPYYINDSDITLALYEDYSWCKYGFYGSPMKLFDYMSCGKPVIASAAGQITDVIEDGINGFLTDNSIKDLVSKIDFLIKNPSKASETGRAARKTVMDFYNWDRVARQTANILEEISEHS